MKQQLLNLLTSVLQQLVQQHKLVLNQLPEIQIERTKDPRHGDYACNVALILAKTVGMKPRDLAELIILNLPISPLLQSVTIAGPGFINFTLNETARYAVIVDILAEPHTYGNSTKGNGLRVLLEFISANPTGPLHVGHGRSAAFGASLANLLRAVGYEVDTEYYVNDAGRQMNILTVSVWLRYLELYGQQLVFPSNGYRGDYVKDIAGALQAKYAEAFVQDAAKIFNDLPADEPAGGDKEVYVDALITKAQQLLQLDGFNTIHQLSLQLILDDIREDLHEFGVIFQQWFAEKSLFDSGAIDNGITALKMGGYTYEKDGALWFNATHFGDEKDRVLLRANGQATYFASDVAYHWNKYDRGYDRIIDIFGADHHGYVSRVKSAVMALGKDVASLDVLLVQFAILYRGKERVAMSTRGGSFVTLRQLREEVGNDAARFFYVMRKAEQHMDFDLELAKSQSNDNPVYYIQYAHARICSVMRQLTEKQLQFNQPQGLAGLGLLITEAEQALLKSLASYPEIIEAAAFSCEPHQLAHFLRELAHQFHTYYNAQQFIVDDDNLRNARLCLIIAVKHVLQHGLQIIGVSFPEQM